MLQNKETTRDMQTLTEKRSHLVNKDYVEDE
jgi:hypothetical protein